MKSVQAMRRVFRTIEDERLLLVGNKSQGADELIRNGIRYGRRPGRGGRST